MSNKNVGSKIYRKLKQISSTSLLLRELNRIYYRRFYTKDYNASGIDIFSEDWDNLLILDACRYDMFKRISNLSGDLSSRISRGSSTNEFIMGNFQDKQFNDTVYVTANPMVYRRSSEWLDVEFHDIINIWREDGWNEKYGTVLPETTAEYAIKAHERYPNKRLLIHFIQPHYPFIADTDADKGHLDSGEAELNIWAQLMRGKLDIGKDRIWQLYNENLERTLPSVQRVIDTIEGKTVVTADHGNMIGERASPIPVIEWGHPYGIHTEELVKVPWLVCDGKQKKIVAEDPVEKSLDNSDNIQERLKSLGYYE